MKIIFLDFDGVIVHKGSPLKGIILQPSSECLARLRRITSEGGAKIVVSSSWRLFHPIEELRAALGDAGEIIGLTEDLWVDRVSDSRPSEIKKWLGERRGEVRSYIVLDDLNMKGFGFRMIAVNKGWELGGLQDRHVERALRALGKPLSPSGQ